MARPRRDGFGDVRATSELGCATAKRAANDDDCDDSDGGIFPGATEVCNQKDDDCDGQVDEGVRITCGRGWCGRFGPSCDPAMCMPGPPMTELCNRFDDDCDGVADNGEPCGPDAMCFEGRCYGIDVLDAGVPVPDAGVMQPADAGTTTPDPMPEPQQPAPPGGCQTVPGDALVLVLWLFARRRA